MTPPTFEEQVRAYGQRTSEGGAFSRERDIHRPLSVQSRPERGGQRDKL